MLAPLLAAVLAAAPGAARATWTNADIAWEAAFVAAVAIDWKTTHDGLRLGFPEANPVARALGTDRACLAAVAVHAIVSAALPARWRRLWQIESFVLEGAAVGRNVAIVGVRFTR